MLTTHQITARADLAALEMPWNILAAGEPMRSWNWLSTWWNHYGNTDNRELHVLAGGDPTDDLVAVPGPPRRQSCGDDKVKGTTRYVSSPAGR